MPISDTPPPVIIGPPIDMEIERTPEFWEAETVRIRENLSLLTDADLKAANVVSSKGQDT